MSEIVVQFKGTVYENGYGQIAKKVMRDKSIHAVAKAIYAYLVSYAGSKDNSFPSVQLMMDELGIRTDGTFYKYRKQLEDAGYITVTQDQGEGGKWLNNVYHIETVPVPKAERKEPYSKKQSTVKVTNRTLKNGVRKKPSAVNQGTNNNRSLITTSFNKNNQIQQQESPTETGAQQKPVVVDIEFLISESLEQIDVKVSDQELTKWINKYGATYVLEKIEVVKGMTTTAPLRTLRAAIKDNWKVNYDNSNKNDSKSNSERLERVVPAAQVGKYERFYQVYGKTAQHQTN